MNYEDAVVAGPANAEPGQNPVVEALNNPKAATNPVCEAALAYAAMGWSVLPIYGVKPETGLCSCGKADCQTVGKHPSLMNWVKGASNQPEQLRQWFAYTDCRNIGIRTGGESGLVVIDIDRKGSVDGAESLKVMEGRYGKLPATVTATTPTGGIHYYFHGGADIKSTSTVLGCSGVDIRCHGGMVIAPPSHRPIGEYAWVDGHGVDEIKLAELPAAWLEALPKINQRKTATTTNNVGHGVVGEGGRNTRLTSIGGKLRRDGLDHDKLLESLQVLNKVICNPPLAETEVGSIASNVSNYKRGEVKLATGPQEEDTRLTDQLLESYQSGSEHGRPIVVLPGGYVRYTDAVNRLAPLVTATLQYFRRGSENEIMRMRKQNGHASLEPVELAEWPTIFEQVASLKSFSTGKQATFKPTVCSVETARVITKAAEFREALPLITVVSRCPVLVEKNGQLECITGYDAESGIWADGEAPQDLPLEEAVSLLTGVLDDFNFATPADRSRAIAALITPALTLGGLIPGPSAVDAGEADEPQTGKGYRNKITTAIYNHTAQIVTQNSRGVGSLEESFSAAVIKGASFIALDNLRGKIESQMLESFLTEDTAMVRVPYRPPLTIDPRRTIVMMTSNQSEFSPDLAKRCSIVRIRKHADDYVFKSYAEGDIVAHVKANQTRHFGAVATIIKTWYAAGKTMPSVAGHDFRAWASILNWIVTNIFKVAPLLDGHKEAQKRTTNANLGWLRLIALAAKAENRLGQHLRTHELLTLMQTHTGIEIPGLADGGDLSNDDVRTKVLQTIGKKIGDCFRKENSITIDDITILRSSERDQLKGRDIKEYVFTRSNETVLVNAGLKPVVTSQPSDLEMTTIRIHYLDDIG